jgi:hypothetical protein
MINSVDTPACTIFTTSSFVNLGFASWAFAHGRGIKSRRQMVNTAHVFIFTPVFETDRQKERQLVKTSSVPH